MRLFSAVKKMVDKHYAAQAAANCNTCHIGAWFVGHENHLMEKSGGLTMKSFFKRLTRKEKESVTDTPIATVQCDCEKDQCKILIVCRGEAFSRSVADYAVSMARKTRSSLVALNVDESGRDFTGFLEESKRNIDYFSCRAAEAGLGFCHEIRQGDEESVVASMHAEDPGLRYVMDDSAVVCKNQKSIPVYTRATLRAK